MAGGLDGRAQRVRRLEGLDRGRERPAPSRTRKYESWKRRYGSSEWTPTSGTTATSVWTCRLTSK
jgi:hypothetical protein